MNGDRAQVVLQALQPGRMRLTQRLLGRARGVFHQALVEVLEQHVAMAAPVRRYLDHGRIAHDAGLALVGMHANLAPVVLQVDRGFNREFAAHVVAGVDCDRSGVEK